MVSPLDRALRALDGLSVGDAFGERFGNGGAMRVAPLGAWFAGDLDRCAEEARASAEVTHAHEEGMAGAVAIAVAAAILVEEPAISASALLDAVAARTPRGYTREGIEAARRLPVETGMVDAAVALGNGSGVSAPDTVPLCLFVAAHVRDDYPEAMWRTVSALGDRDTTCAIVGGLLAAAGTPLPEEWLSRREPLDHISAGITSMR